MSTREIFKEPTVEKVMFQIRFSNLFFIEDRIGEFQALILKEFPESRIVQQQNRVLAQIGLDGKLLIPPPEVFEAKRVWEFESPKQYKMEVGMSSVSITSEYHKSYNHREASVRFRDIIEFAVAPFLKLTGLTLLKRIGLRYVDKCPVFEKTNAWFKQNYKSVFPLSRFKIEATDGMVFRGVSKYGDYNLIYAESLNKEDDKFILVIDTDAYAYDIAAEDYLTVTDKLHKIIWNEYNKTVREPLKEIMRGNWKEAWYGKGKNG